MSAAISASTGPFDPFSEEAHRDPYPAYRRLRAAGRLHHNPDRNLWFVPHYDDVLSITRDLSTFSNEPTVDIDGTGAVIGSGNFLDQDPPRHGELRNIVRRSFAPLALRERLEGATEHHVEALLSKLDPDGDVDLAQDFAWRLPVEVTSDLLGVPTADRGPLGNLIRRFAEREHGVPDVPAAARAAGDSLVAYFEEHLNARRVQPGEDLVSAIAQADGLHNDPAGAAGMTFLLFLAGIETTASLIGHGLNTLAEHPDQRAFLIDNAGHMPAAIEEVLRYQSPIVNTMRTAKRDTELYGHAVPKDARVVLLLASANRDERRWSHAECFAIHREPQRHLAFGDGIHHCVGAPLARLEARIALDAVLRRHPAYQISGDPVYTTSHVVRGIVTLPVQLR